MTHSSPRLPYQTGRIVGGSTYDRLEVAVQVLISCYPINNYFNTLRQDYKTFWNTCLHVFTKSVTTLDTGRNIEHSSTFKGILAEHHKTNKLWYGDHRTPVDYLFVLLDELATPELQSLYTRTAALTDTCPACGHCEHPPNYTRDRMDIHDIRSDLDVAGLIHSGMAYGQDACQVCATPMVRTRKLESTSKVLFVIIHRSKPEDMLVPMDLAVHMDITDAHGVHNYMATAYVYEVDGKYYYSCLRYDISKNLHWVTNLPDCPNFDPKLHTLLVVYCN